MESFNKLVSWGKTNGQELVNRLDKLSSLASSSEINNEDDFANLFANVMGDLPSGYSNLVLLIEDASFDIINHIHDFFESFYSHIPESKFTTKLEEKLDDGNSDVLLLLIVSTIQSLKKEHPNKEIKLPPFSLRQMYHVKQIFKLTNGPIVQNLGRALLCIHKGQKQTAKSCIQLSMSLVISKLQPSVLRNAAIKREGVIEKAKLAGAKGQEQRWAAKNKVQEFAINLKNNSDFPNDNQAAISLTPIIIEFANKNEHRFSSEFQATKLIYKWFREDSKMKS